MWAMKMLTAKDILNQINRLTGELIETKLCNSENVSVCKPCGGDVKEIGISSGDDSIFLKSIPYFEMFKEATERKIYNVQMIDGALIFMQYRFYKNRLVAHRLSYLPSPDLDAFQNEPEIYVEDERYAEVVNRRIVCVPVRFDFDNDKAVCRPIKHPASHMTLGQFKNCRIPVTGALTPYQFISFIITSFYHTAFTKYNSHFQVYKESFEPSIFDEEREIMHFHTPEYRH
jgi:hypothetical protein